MSDKYIIRNCPAISFADGCKNEEVKVWNCQDCTDCVMKQIAIMCNYAIHGAKATGHFNFLGEKILELLDIEEVE